MNPVRRLWELLIHLLLSLVREPWDLLIILLRRILAAMGVKRSRKQLPCLPLPPDIVRKPDPLIYCQSYLTSLGLAVTWDNPDIHIRKGGLPVDPHDLQPDTDYEVAITVHNGSNEAPAPGVKVQLNYRKWGVAGPWNFVTQGVVDLPVRGAPGEPAGIILPWHTPSAAGHFCLLVVLQHPNDLNPLNNFGQTNTDIRRGAKRGEKITVDIPVMHLLAARRTLQLQLTSYTLPKQAMYPPSPEGALQRYEAAIERLGRSPSLPGLLDAANVTGPVPVDNWTAYRIIRPSRPGKPVAIRQFGEDWLPRIVAANSPQAHLPPAAWGASLSRQQITLEPNVEELVQLTLQVPASSPPGTLQPFQVNAFDDLTGLAGGVEVVIAVG